MIENNIIQKIQKVMFEKTQSSNNIFGKDVWMTHILPVTRYAKLLAKKREADVEVVEIAALLHDIAGISNQEFIETHHIEGQIMAQEILSSLHYTQEKIDQVKHCILAHRGSKSIMRETVEASCVADADAMAHFDGLYSLFYLAYHVKQKDPFEGRDFVLGKLERSWNKLTSDAKEIIRPKYEAIKLLLTDDTMRRSE